MDKEKIKKIDNHALMAELHTSLAGLSSTEAQNRLLRYGQNILKNETRKKPLELILKQFKSSLVYLLVVAAALAFLLRDFNDGLVIAVILLINTGLGFIQEYRSEKAIEKLQKLVDKEILVTRDNKQTLVPEKLLVPGDIVILREGDIVPADIRLYEVDDMTVNESQISGESVPLTKTTNGLNALIYAGSVIEGGEAKGVVYATSGDTELGKIAHLSTSTKRITQFEQSLSSFSNFLVKVTFLTLLAIFILKLILVHDTSEIGTLLLFIIALSIAVVPEAMPVIITVTLSRGALNLAKRHVIAKTLSAVEDLGDITILCSDKTGTLTENKQTIKNLIADDPRLFQRLAIASLESLDEKRKKFQNSFDKAFLDYVAQDIKAETVDFKRIEELPFDPNARRRRVVFSEGSKTYLVEIGSVETLLTLTKHPKTEKYLSILRTDGSIGLRHLGIAYKEIHYNPSDGFDIIKHEHDLIFAGFVALEDPLRPSAKHTITLAEKLGVSIKILSGDSREVTQYVATEVGLNNQEQKVHTGEDIDNMNDEQLAEVVQKNNAFARLNPEQKYRIINLLKLHGDVVGYQGDGINDAPALKLADVAIAVNNATDVARDSADILLLRSDIGVIINGISYGRGIFANINKYIKYTFVNGWGTFFALSVLYLLSIVSLPILPVQLLLTNLLTDLPCITIATDNVETKELLRPSRFNVHSLMFISICLGLVTAVFEIMYYSIIRNSSPHVAATGMYLFLTFTALIVIFSIRNKEHFWRAPRLSIPMKIAFACITLLSIILVYIPATQKLLSFSALSFGLFLLTTLMTIIYFVVMDVIKVWFYREQFGISH